MKELIRIFAIVLILICIPLLSIPQNQECCDGGKEFSLMLSGSCKRILPNNPVRSYTISRIRDTEGAIIELINGDLLAIWSKFTDQGVDDAPGWLVGRKSKDGGQNWGKEFMVSGVWGMQNAFSPSLLRLPNNEILLFVLAKHDKYEEDIFVMRSSDEGNSWSCPLEINDGLQQAYHVMNNDRVIQLQNGSNKGRIICPVAFSPNVSISGSNSNAYFKVVMYYSDDNGYSWSKGNAILPPSGYARGIMEPAIVEVSNGKLLMLLRTTKGHFLKSLSTDGGINWNPLTILKDSANGQNIATTESPCSIKIIPCTEDLLLIYSDGNINLQGKPRRHLAYRISSDDGSTWGTLNSLDGGGNSQKQYSYTSINFIKDRVLLTYYEHELANTSNTGIQTFSQKFFSAPSGWFYGIRDTSMAGEDIIDCWRNSPFVLQAKLPSNLTGSWSVLSGTNFSFVDSLSPNTLFSGSNQKYSLIWELFRGGTCIHKDTVLVDLTLCGPTSIDDNYFSSEKLDSLRIIYFPENKKLSISQFNPEILPATVLLYDMNGKPILSGFLSEKKIIQEFDLTSLNLPSGIYLVEIISKKQKIKGGKKLLIK